MFLLSHSINNDSIQLLCLFLLIFDFSFTLSSYRETIVQEIEDVIFLYLSVCYVVSRLSKRLEGSTDSRISSVHATLFCPRNQLFWILDLYTDSLTLPVKTSSTKTSRDTYKSLMSVLGMKR